MTIVLNTVGCHSWHSQILHLTSLLATVTGLPPPLFKLIFICSVLHQYFCVTHNRWEVKCIENNKTEGTWKQKISSFVNYNKLINLRKRNLNLHTAKDTIKSKHCKKFIHWNITFSESQIKKSTLHYEVNMERRHTINRI